MNMKSGICTVALAGLFAAAPMVHAQTCNGNIPLEKPDSRYTDNGNGTVTDHVTGLMWKQCSEGLSTTSTPCDTGSASTYTWSNALAQAQTVNSTGFATYSDWRLPNIKELKSLTEKACYNPAINTTYFPATPSSVFWSASPSASSSDYAWDVYFSNGGDAWWDYKVFANHVRLVRAGQ